MTTERKQAVAEVAKAENAQAAGQMIWARLPGAVREDTP